MVADRARQLSLHRTIEKLWWSENEPPLLLRLASHLYAPLNALNLKLRRKRCESPELPLISIGNITVGGSGKTPFVIWLAKLLRQQGYTPVVLCRGDGGTGKTVQLLNDRSDPLEVGDEAVLLQQQCGCHVIAGRDRVRAARMASEYGDIVILDDGFQYRQLGRSCDIVLVPAEGIGNGHLIPAGPLREPVESLARADLIVRTGDTETVRPLTDNMEWRWQACGSHLTQIIGEKSDRPAQAVILTAIARPERFLASLDATGVDIASSYVYPDHHRFSSGEIEQALTPRLPVICTTKDAVKLKRIWPNGSELWVLEQHAEAEEGLFDAITNRIGSISREVNHGDT